MALQPWCSQNIPFISEQTCFELHRKLCVPRPQGPTGPGLGPKAGGGAHKFILNLEFRTNFRL